MSTPGDLVSVVMATFNGASFIRQQLDSILAQTHQNLQIVVSDDGSTDGTIDVLQEYATTGKLCWFASRAERGPKPNFSNALAHAKGSYIAFSDQDDIWKPTKLAASLEAVRAIERAHGVETPVLVYTDLELVNEDLTPISSSYYGFMRRDPRKNSLNRLLFEVNVLGCSSLGNRALVQAAGSIPNEAAMHDSWFPLVACALGQLEFLDVASVLYRQHRGNVIGARKRPMRELLRKTIDRGLDRGYYLTKSLMPCYSQARVLLRRYEPILGFATVELLRNFLACEHQGFVAKRINILRHGFLRHNTLESVELLLRV